MPRRSALVEHEGTSNRAAAYCDRCERGFKSEHGLALHMRDSRRHWECPTCNHDADGWDALLDHCRETDCRSVCQGCDEGAGKHWTLNCAAFRQHVEDFNVCTFCEEHFSSLVELTCHDCFEIESSTEEDTEDEGYGNEEEEEGEDADDGDNDEECLKCDRMFTTYNGMILHLESGTCSEVNRTTLDMHAARCYWWSSYMFPHSRSSAFYGYIMDTNTYHYKCPSCETPTTRLSGLLQHVELGSCEQTFTDGAIDALCTYLKENV